MHMTIERFLEAEARAAGMDFPIVKRSAKGQFGLFESADMLGASPRFVERFTDQQDAMKRIGAVAMAYARNQSDQPNEPTEQKDAAIIDDRA